MSKLLNSRTAALPAILIAAGLASARPAAAADYCVAPKTTCGAANNVGTFQAALDRADNDAAADRIFLGAATYTAPAGTGFDYQAGPVEVSGQGAGETIVTSDNFSDEVLRLIGGPSTFIHDLTVRLPWGAAKGFKGLVTDGVARRIDVTEDAGPPGYRFGVALGSGGTLEESKVTLGTTGDSTAVLFDVGGGTVRDSLLRARTGVESRAGGTIERSRVSGAYAGVVTGRNVTRIASSIVRATGPFATGVSAGVAGGVDGEVHLDGAVLEGAGGPSTNGVAAVNFPDATRSVKLTLTNSLIRGFDTPLRALGFGAGSAHVTASYSDYDASKNVVSGANAGITESSISHVGDAGFVDAAAGNYHLLPHSPLVDAGDPATGQGIDLDGNPLITDGNHDGIARRDIGAFEAPGAVIPPAPPIGGGDPPRPPVVAPGTDTQPPVVSGFRTTRKVFTVGRGRGTRFRYMLSERATVTVRIRRRSGRTVGKLVGNGSAGENVLRFSGRIGSKRLRPGRYSAVVTATDAAGNRSAERRAGFTITSARGL